MKKINLLVALTLSLNVFSQEMKKDTTHKEIKKSEKVSPGVKHYFDHHYEYLELKRCKWVSSKGVRCNYEGYGGDCRSQWCAKRK